MMAVEIPAWAWGLIVTVLAGGFGTLGKMLAYLATRMDTRIDGIEKRTGKVENRVTALEAREAA